MVLQLLGPFVSYTFWQMLSVQFSTPSETWMKNLHRQNRVKQGAVGFGKMWKTNAQMMHDYCVFVESVFSPIRIHGWWRIISGRWVASHHGRFSPPHNRWVWQCQTVRALPGYLPSWRLLMIFFYWNLNWLRTIDGWYRARPWKVIRHDDW